MSAFSLLTVEDAHDSGDDDDDDEEDEISPRTPCPRRGFRWECVAFVEFALGVSLRLRMGNIDYIPLLTLDIARQMTGASKQTGPAGSAERRSLQMF
jgi:hypothetical protein